MHKITPCTQAAENVVVTPDIESYEVASTSSAQEEDYQMAEINDHEGGQT